MIDSGKDDEVQLQALAAYLVHTLGFAPDRIKKEPFLLFSQYDGSLAGTCYQMVTQEELDGCVAHHPDIVILNKRGRPICIVELDGSYHDSKTGRRKTERRNGHYRDARIPCIVLNIADLKLLKKTWFDFLEDEIRRLKIK